jgi:hypothetical protein
VMVCNEPTCNAHPITCIDGECACQGPHRKHPQLHIRDFLDKVNESSVMLAELKQSEKAINGLIDSMTNIIDRCRDRHRRIVEDYMAKHNSFAWLRQMLINRQQPNAKDMTGGNMAKMLAEIEQLKHMKSPYTMGADGIERQAL